MHAWKPQYSKKPTNIGWILQVDRVNEINEEFQLSSTPLCVYVRQTILLSGATSKSVLRPCFEFNCHHCKAITFSSCHAPAKLTVLESHNYLMWNHRLCYPTPAVVYSDRVWAVEMKVLTFVPPALELVSMIKPAQVLHSGRNTKTCIKT